MTTQIRQPQSYQRLLNYLHSRLSESREVQITHRELGEELGLGKSSIILLVSQVKRFNPDWEVVSSRWENESFRQIPTTYRYLGN